MVVGHSSEAISLIASSPESATLIYCSVDIEVQTHTAKRLLKAFFQLLPKS